jgi:hypothetical protein
VFTPPYPSPTQPAKGDESRRRHGICNALGGYIGRKRDIGMTSAGATATSQFDDVVTKYGEVKSSHA